MANGLIRFFTGEPEPARNRHIDTAALAREHMAVAELTGFKMELDQALTRSAINSVAEVHRFREYVANGDPQLDALIRPMEIAFADRQARRLRGEL